MYSPFYKIIIYNITCFYSKVVYIKFICNTHLVYIEINRKKLFEFISTKSNYYQFGYFYVPFYILLIRNDILMLNKTR